MIKFFYGNSRPKDAEEILENVNRYVELRNNEGDVDFSDELLYRALMDMEEYISAVNQTYNVDPIISVETTNPIKKFIKRFIRKMVQWCFNDIFSKQIEFNARLVQYINAESFLLRNISDECIKLKDEKNNLELKLKNMEEK